MKKIFLNLMTSTSFILQAQQEIVTTNSLVGVQAGLFGVNAYYEKNFSETFSLTPDVGFSPSIWRETFIPCSG